MITTLILIAWVSIAKGQVFLQVSGSDLMYNGEKAFLSGMNLAWHNFGNDFGNGQYDCCTGAVLENYLAELSASGGNTLRVWLHCDGTSTPQFADSGEVISTDEQNTMVSDLQKFLDAAFSYDIFVILVLWNGATYPNQKVIDLMCDDSKLQSYLDNSLTPLVQGLRSKVALGAWEIMNEPEGMVYAGEANENDCYDTTILTDTGAGWVEAFVQMYNLQKFINRQAAHIKALDSKALVTVGSWSELSASDALGISRNYYTDE